MHKDEAAKVKRNSEGNINDIAEGITDLCNRNCDRSDITTI